MKNSWKVLSDTYKILIAMLVFIMLIQLSTLLYIWKVESKILLKKEGKRLEYQLDINAKLFLKHMHGLKKELEFLATLEIMDDIVVKDIDKRIAILLKKKAKDLSEEIVLLAMTKKQVIASSQKKYKLKNFLEFKVPIYASFDKDKKLGYLLLLYPFKNLMNLEMDSPYQSLWLTPPFEKRFFKPNFKESIIVSKYLKGIFKKWKLSLAYEKEYALQSVKEIEQILFFAFMLSLLALLFVVIILSKRQINILEHTQEVLELKRTFLSTMSHELRTPLGSVLTLTQHLMVNPRMGNDEVETLAGIENASEHLLGMINNLLQLSKLESNVMPIKKESVDLSLLIEEIIELVEPLISEKQLCLKKGIFTEPSIIMTDVNLFKQVLINLFSNAIKFTNEGCIEITLSQKNGLFLFQVKDTGIGIEKEKQVSLFSEFYQAHKKEIKHSSGLGLALSQKVASLLNGKITIRSEGMGEGTEASFKFSSL
jgi:signal transduction histidine kinase